MAHIQLDNLQVDGGIERLCQQRVVVAIALHAVQALPCLRVRKPRPLLALGLAHLLLKLLVADAGGDLGDSFGSGGDKTRIHLHGRWVRVVELEGLQQIA